jgi:XRE family transcriptional regulator, aerobic/anaerobic benzoate catabolism transcriptional regulator
MGIILPPMDRLLGALGERIRSLRTRSGLTARELALRSDLSERFVRDLEAGRGNISVLRLAKIGAALGESAGAMLREAEERLGRRATAPLVALLGLRGAGKTAVGRRLAARLRVPFFELDRLVEATAGLSLPEIFAVHGESYYRRLELESLRNFLDEHRSGVLATGGGIAVHEEAFRLLQERAFTVWLKADPEDHWQRVVRQGDPRPMANNPRAQTELRRILAEREPYYARAHHQVDTSRLGLRGTVDGLVKTLRASAETAPRWHGSSP